MGQSKREQLALLNDQSKIIQQIASGTPLKYTLELIMKSLERSSESVELNCSIALFDPVKKVLGETIVSSLPTSCSNRMQAIMIGTSEDFWTRESSSKQPIFLSEDQYPKEWTTYCNEASNFGFKACCFFPILSSKKASLGVLTLHYKEIVEPDPEMINRIEQYVQLAVVAIENAENSLNQSVQQMLHSFETMNELNVKEKSDVEVLAQLHKALDREEFEVYYQPYFGAGNVGSGMEALIRWNHPVSGVLPPGAFLDVAEESGFILEMEIWVLKRAIRDAKTLRRSGLEDLVLSVNISAQQLENPVFPDLLADILEHASYRPENLTLEVTERFLINKNAVKAIDSIMKSGVKISIDDFGTAYSSLQYLKDLHVDELKIDRSFIMNLETDFSNQKIVEMIIMLGHQLDLKVVAEGVETEIQFQMLKDMKCDKVQGFLFSKPLPLGEFAEKYIPIRQTINN